jgi:hypothetical protein
MVFLLGFSRVLGFFFFGFRGSCWGFWGWFGCFLRAFIVLRGLLMGVSIVLWRLLLCLLEVFLWVLLSFLCGLAGLLLCILSVYLGAPYAFFNEILLLIKKYIYIYKLMSLKDSLKTCNTIRIHLKIVIFFLKKKKKLEVKQVLLKA